MDKIFDCLQAKYFIYEGEMILGERSSEKSFII